MKNIIFLTLFIFYNTISYSQKFVAQDVKNYLNNGVHFTKYNVLISNHSISSDNIDKIVEKYSLANADIQGVNTIFNNKNEFVEITIPYQDENIDILLYKVNPFIEGFTINTDQSQNIDYSQGVYYRGCIKNDYNSVATFNFFENEMNGIISNDKYNNLVIGKLIKSNNINDYIIYSDAEMNVLNDFHCATKTKEISDYKTTNQKEITSNKCVSMYLEIDRDIYSQNGSDITNTTNWITSVFNNVKTIYQNDGITVGIKSIYIWTNQDPYQGSGNSSADYLYKFMEIRPVFNGDVAQLVSIDAGGLGGVAIGTDGICTSFNHSYTDVDINYSSVPTYSWTIEVMTHEFGHLLGSPHTHGCYWNGNNTAIDGCGSSVGYVEGSCPQGPIPSNTVKGTIMSYCHLVSGVGINFNNGFGPQPAALILNKVNNGLCLSTDCINTCINTVGSVEVQNIGNNTATISWNELGSSSNWQVAIYPFNGSPLSWTTVTTNSFTQNNLLPNTYYIAAVRPNCSNGLEGASRQIIFATTTDYCNNVTFYDTGGPQGDYLDNQTVYRTLIPSLPNKKIKLTFNFFSLEQDYDYFYIYNGNSTQSPSFNPSGYTGNSIPGPFISTAADGSLTTKFYSDGGVIDAGWEATVTCLNSLGFEDFEGIDFKYFPNPAKNSINFESNNTISNIKIFNSHGQLLYNENSSENQITVYIKNWDTGLYFAKILIKKKEINLKIVKE